jgi:hypothetical protein
MSQKLKTLQIIHLSICAGVILGYVILGDFSPEVLQMPIVDSNSIIYAIIPLIAFVFSNFIFRSQINKIDAKVSFDEQFPMYQTASIVRWAILEGAAFVLLILKKDFILFGILLIVYLLLLFPSEFRVKSDLEKIKIK